MNDQPHTEWNDVPPGTPGFDKNKGWWPLNHQDEARALGWEDAGPYNPAIARAREEQENRDAEPKVFTPDFEPDGKTPYKRESYPFALFLHGMGEKRKRTWRNLWGLRFPKGKKLVIPIPQDRKGSLWLDAAGMALIVKLAEMMGKPFPPHESAMSIDWDLSVYVDRAIFIIQKFQEKVVEKEAPNTIVFSRDDHVKNVYKIFGFNDCLTREEVLKGIAEQYNVTGIHCEYRLQYLLLKGDIYTIGNMYKGKYQYQTT